MPEPETPPPYAIVRLLIYVDNRQRQVQEREIIVGKATEHFLRFTGLTKRTIKKDNRHYEHTFQLMLKDADSVEKAFEVFDAALTAAIPAGFTLVEFEAAQNPQGVYRIQGYLDTTGRQIEERAFISGVDVLSRYGGMKMLQLASQDRPGESITEKVMFEIPKANTLEEAFLAYDATSDLAIAERVEEIQKQSDELAKKFMAIQKDELKEHKKKIIIPKG